MHLILRQRGSTNGGAAYEVMLAGSQLLNSDDFPDESRQLMSPESIVLLLAVYNCQVDAGNVVL